jgi:hypothetical protein
MRMLSILETRTRLSRASLILSMIALAAAGGSAGAQTAVIGGTVLRDSTEKGLGEAEVSIAALGRTARTNYLGEFRIDGLGAGTYVVVFRRVGFTPRTDTITVANGQVVDGEYILRSAPVELGAQQTVATAVASSPLLAEFNDRMKAGQGHFVTEEVLRKEADNHNFMNFVKGRFPGMRVVTGSGGAQYLASGRKACVGPAFQCAGAAPCYVTVYIDGNADYVSGVSHREPTDFNQLKSEDFVAIEYYSSGATAPSRYNQTGSDCGILMLWRRYHAP